MHTRDDHNQLATMNPFERRIGNRASFREWVRVWVPYVLTVVVVPGGILIALVMLWHHWNKRRLAVQSPARA